MVDGCPGQGRNLLELIPGKRKTVWIDQPLVNYVFGGLIPLAIGIALLGFTLFIVLDSLFKHDWTGILPAMVTLLFGGGLTFAGGLSLYVVIDSSRGLTLEALSGRFNVSEDTLIQVTREKQILPRYNIMGRIVYSPGDFDSLSLLRASSPLITADELLRADSNKPTPPDLLLRRSSAPGSTTEADSPSPVTTRDTTSTSCNR